MRKALLLYNPLSGQRQERRLEEIEAALNILRNAGVEVSGLPTKSGADATEQARHAVTAGCDTVFACGGDGTIHDVLQGLVGTETALSVIPMGTANALAHDLGLPLRPDKAAQAALSAERRRIAVGKIECQGLAGNEVARYFTVAVGVGVDAYLFHKLDPSVKRRFGMISYYGKATWLWLTHRMEKFSVECGNPGGNSVLYTDVTQLLTARIRNFGGILRELVPAASLKRDDMPLVLFKTRSRASYLKYIACCLVGVKRKCRGIDSCDASTVVCALPEASQASSRVFVEADGELLGTLPAKISTVPAALTLLFPKR